jgi:hypothetical protein
MAHFAQEYCRQDAGGLWQGRAGRRRRSRRAHGRLPHALRGRLLVGPLIVDVTHGDYIAIPWSATYDVTAPEGKRPGDTFNAPFAEQDVHKDITRQVSRDVLETSIHNVVATGKDVAKL